MQAIGGRRRGGWVGQSLDVQPPSYRDIAPTDRCSLVCTALLEVVEMSLYDTVDLVGIEARAKVSDPPLLRVVLLMVVSLNGLANLLDNKEVGRAVDPPVKHVVL